MKPLIILTGATAVGKTKLSIDLAKRINASVISADSMQVYRYMDIGTAKIRPEETEGITHYLIDEFLPDEEFNVTVFQDRAKKYIDKIYSEGKIPLIVGGTGFYIGALLYDVDFNSGNETEEESSECRKELFELAEQKGKEHIYELLRERDPEYSKVVHPNNLKKVVRALEYCMVTGEKFSEYNEREKKRTSPYDFRYFVIENDRSTIHENINRRVDIMLENGLVNEVRSLLDKGYSADLVSMQGLGYKEIVKYIKGQCTLDEAVEELKTGTRRFARRQITWFKREPEAIHINISDYSGPEEILDFILSQCKDLIPE